MNPAVLWIRVHAPTHVRRPSCRTHEATRASVSRVMAHHTMVATKHQPSASHRTTYLSTQGGQNSAHEQINLFP